MDRMQVNLKNLTHSWLGVHLKMSWSQIYRKCSTHVQSVFSAAASVQPEIKKKYKKSPSTLKWNLKCMSFEERAQNNHIKSENR